ncbi:MAG: glycoside hydrolase family 30 beta sandwich domain-containing protein [Lachnospiraceae bacterium]|nr:glycoside hydrolase family 30 beta sandwich domain-containing protein [Lachnospiraceae bacterium]
MKTYVSDCNVKMQENQVAAIENPDYAPKLVKLYPEAQFQTVIGFGGAFTESAAYIWDGLGEKEKEEVIDAYFGENGNHYTFGRTHIQSCDFSLGNRAYLQEGDRDLETFSIEEDFRYQIPFIKAALAKNKDIQFLASPWSPPAFMKDNQDMNHGGKLKKEYYQKWAQVMANYLLAYRREGINIQRVTVQNEPAAVQTWDSCLYTAEEEGAFAVNYLRKELDQAGLSEVKILVWDHNKDLIVERAEGSMSVPGADEAVAGFAFHWYTGDHFEALDYVGRKYPDKELIFTEGCVEYSRFSDDQTANAQMYAHDMIGNLKAGMNGFLDWNLLLDMQGGPNHVGNFCDAPIMCDVKENKVVKNLSYYYIGHFSRFIQPGAVRILATSSQKDTETVAFQNPDGTIAAVVLNESDQTQEFYLSCGRQSWKIEMQPHSILTACLD